MQYTAEIFKPLHSIASGQVSASSPSNIALVKYWGKKENQIPANPSVSYTLQRCKTDTTLIFSEKKNDVPFDVKVIFEGKENEKFAQKVITFFDKIVAFCPYLTQYQFEIQTQNSFPHSSGIASSASGMSAIALALTQLEQLLGADYTEEERLKRASFFARLGSGSASRSVYNGLILWGKHPEIPYSSDEIAQPLQSEIHPVFKQFNDSILIVHKGQKTVSSTQGHNLMHQHPFAEKRFEQAYQNITKLQNILQQGDLEQFGELVESEALTLHAMMMTSIPYFILIQPNTLEVINAIWNFRKETQTPVYFTLDAGANVHVLYPQAATEKVQQFIENDLKKYCEDGFYIHDIIAFD